jgi:hypothetical protein
VPGGVVHKLPGDLRKALIANPAALDAWKDITPLARNEFICWVEGCQAADDPRTPHSPDPGGAEGRHASALLLARMQAPRTQRHIAVGLVPPIASSRASGLGRVLTARTSPSRMTVLVSRKGVVLRYRTHARFRTA